MNYKWLEDASQNVKSTSSLNILEKLLALTWPHHNPLNAVIHWKLLSYVDCVWVYIHVQIRWGLVWKKVEIKSYKQFIKIKEPFILSALYIMYIYNKGPHHKTIIYHFGTPGLTCLNEQHSHIVTHTVLESRLHTTTAACRLSHVKSPTLRAWI